MDKKDFYYLGKIIKASGHKGNLVFFFDVDDVSHYHELEAIFVDIGGQLIPLIINQIIFRKGNQALVTLDEIETSEGAEGYIGLNLYLPLAYLPPLSGNNFYFHEVLGFSVIDKTYGRLGDIQRVMDQTSQPVFVIAHGEKEILIPVAEEIILKVDRKKKEIRVDSPAGLIDIYLSK